ncbi:MAG: lamin tail domain-containing protein, partial [Phycisphaerae bacterium]|nr:lamin tail domain-containing protein [Phycisphaerae bacterium]
MLRSVKTLLLSLVLVAALARTTGVQAQIVGDLNADHVVDSKDVQAFAWQWLAPYCLTLDCIADLNGANGVNMADFALLAKNWQKVNPHIVINEFMASNASRPPFDPNELLDGNGDSSDWIEIYNPTDTTINLNGWYLTDNKNDLKKWRFPDGLQVKPGEFLIIFASEKTFEENPLNYPYLDPNGYYHTNFELDKGGDYLALVAEDGNTIAHQYVPEYPQQLTNVSYGMAQHATTLVPTGATASYHVPTVSDAGVGTDWTEVGFDDSTWDTGPTGLGFGSGVATDVQQQMQNVNASLWIRIEFDLGEIDPAFFETLMLRMKYEDGFVAYLNGQYLTERNAPGSLPWNSTSLSDRPIEDSSVFEEINLLAYLNLLRSGVNVLAVHGLNDNKNDSEFLILPELVVARILVTPQYFTTSTPGKLNISGAMGVVSDVWLSTGRTFYTGPPDWHIDLTLSNGTKGAEIRYTLDGTRPTANHGFIYNPAIDPPLKIDKTTIIRAIAVKPGWLDSKVETHTYIFLDNVIQQPPYPSGFPTNGWGHAGPDYEMDPVVVSTHGTSIKDDLKAVPTLSLVMDVNDWFGRSGQGIYPQGELSERAVSA